MTTQHQPRSCNGVDREIAMRLRTRRLQLGLSQDHVAREIGVTFQQLQKYEQAINRVSASTLYRLTQALKMNVSDLFPDPGKSAPPSTDAKDISTALDAFLRLRTPEARSAALEFLAKLAEPSNVQPLKPSRSGKSRPVKSSA